MNRKPITLAISAVAAASVGLTGFATTHADAATSRAVHTTPATKVTRANLPAASSIRLDDRTMVTRSSFAGPGQAPIAPCQMQSWQVFKPNASFSRLYVAKGRPAARAGVQVASFSSHAAAVKAADAMDRSLRCRSQAAAVDMVVGASVQDRTRTIRLSGGQTVHLHYTSYALLGDEYITREDTAVFATGTHVALVNLNYGTQDSDDAQLVRTVKASLPAVAR